MVYLNMMLLPGSIEKSLVSTTDDTTKTLVFPSLIGNILFQVKNTECSL